MRVFANAWFERFARKERIGASVLLDAVKRAENGLVDADLGGGVIKQRLARPGEGKSGGYRTIIIFRARGLAVFVYGYPKSKRDNIDRDELRAFRNAAQYVLGLSFEEMAALAASGHFFELRDGEEKEE
ncbi:MAG: type II toxin-antitoxin system RelE/ParE family toxin [Salinarimonadaceae bacterium]|nr:MAG: type II toxin-antitoxin system RelE/ParE family toxin [Salinarimonadaceae bacterium]